jgi:hypothetical protein
MTLAYGKKKIEEYTYSPDDDHWICPRCKDFVDSNECLGEYDDKGDGDGDYLVCRRCFFIFDIAHDNNSKDAIKHAYKADIMPWSGISHFRIPTKYSIKSETFETIEIEKKLESMVYIKSIGEVNNKDVKILSYKCSCVDGENCTLPWWL